MPTASELWTTIFHDLQILDQIERNGIYEIDANTIKQYKEPRLMTKFDCYNGLPKIMRDNKISILPNTRGTYLLGHFNIFKELPDADNTPVTSVPFPAWLKSINPTNIQSESVAISTAEITPMFQDFFEDDSLIGTVSGRMGSGDFNFTIDGIPIVVANSQIEIDGALESPTQFILIEGKNVLHESFNIRQLYYPYRRYKNEIANKPIKTLYLEYSNNIYRLLEYRFSDLTRYDSCEFVRQKKYRISIDTDKILLQDIIALYRTITPTTDTHGAPFIQCDKFDKIINILENLATNETVDENFISTYFDFDPRQANYYFNGCRFLGLADKNDAKQIELTENGLRIMQLPYKEKQLEIVRCILGHSVFYDLFGIYINSHSIDKSIIIQKMREYQVCTENLMGRRSNSVLSWFSWILDLITE